MKIKIISIILIYVILFVPNIDNTKYCVYASDSASSSIVIESNSQRVLYENNANALRANASTTKIVTFLTVLKNVEDFNQIVEVDDRAVGIEGTSIYLRKGEKLSVLELLYGMMLVSGNDAATALALFVCDSVEEFAIKMTQEAKNAGALKSSFKNPHGLDANGHLTTAYDLAMITSECFKYPLFSKIVSTKSIKIPASKKGEFRYLANKNKLLHSLNGCTGVKTGYTTNAGRCLVSSAFRDNMHLISVVLNCGPMFEESSARLNFLFKKYSMVTLLDAYKYMQNLQVEDGDTSFVKVYSKKQFCYPLTKDELQKIVTKTNLPNKLNAPLEKEQIVGDIKIYFDNNLIFTENIYTIDSVKSIKFLDNAKRVIDFWLNK